MPQPADRPTILVVDDDAGIRSMLQLALAERGYLVDAIGERAEGWAGRPDLVLLDARLGHETAAQFLAAADLGDVPVILLTGDQDAGRIGAELGVAGVLRKPFDLVDLFATIDAVVGSVVSGRQGGRIDPVPPSSSRPSRRSSPTPRRAGAGR